MKIFWLLNECIQSDTQDQWLLKNLIEYGSTSNEDPYWIGIHINEDPYLPKSAHLGDRHL